MRTTTKGFLFLTSSSVLIAAASWLAACGGDDSTATTEDAGSETSTTPPPTPTPNPPPPPDDGGQDAGDGGCVADNTACTTDQGSPGLCKGGACSTCTDPTDDTACKTAYGSTVDGGALICNKGTCAPGNCRTNADCAGGTICGVNVANTCGTCATNNDCINTYGANYVCNNAGSCVTSASVCTNADAGACTGITGDVCCIPAGGDAGACVVGTCCSDSQCNTAGGEKCLGNKCSGCDAPTDTYIVDPSVADDSKASGSGLQGGQPAANCAFNSITHAISAIGNGKVAPVTILIKTGTTTFGAKETFPITVPPYVTIKSQDTANPATLQVPSGKRGIVLVATNSGVSYLNVDGQAKVGTDGIVALTGSSSTTTKIDHVAVQNFQTNGIVVGNTGNLTTGGGLAIGPGVKSTGNGGAGLLVRDNGVAVVTGADGARTQFDSNQQGIHVANLGQLTLTGTPGATPLTTATVTANSNTGVGLVIDQTPQSVSEAGAPPPINTITGLTAWNTTAGGVAGSGSGIRLVAGSNVKLRGSTSLGNALNGIHVVSYPSVPVVDDVSHIDLGTNGDDGHNVLQAPASADAGAPPANLGAGICFQVTASVGQILSAYGNTFVTNAKPVASVDCSATAGVISKSASCINGVSIGIPVAANTNTVIALKCTQQ